MKIKAIKAEQFQGFSDLEVQGLHSGLNVIQMPSWESVDEIHECVVSTLLPIDDELCRTSLELGLDDQSFRLDGINSLGEITATRHDNSTQDITRLSEHLLQFPQIVFERLFTDHENLKGFADQWEKVGLLPRILAKVPLDLEIDEFARTDFSLEIDEHAAQLERIIQADSDSSFTDSVNHKSELAEMYREKKELTDRKQELEHRSAELVSNQKVLESALSVMELWQTRESLDDDSTILSQLELLEESKIEIGSIDRQIQRLRNKIEKNKKQAEKKKQPKPSRLDKLLADENKALRAEEQIEDLRYRIRSTDSTPNTRTDIPKRSSRELLARLRPFAVAIKSARADLARQKQKATELPNEKESESEPDDFLSGIAVTDLQERVDILNSECNRLRQPIELSSNLSFAFNSVAALGAFLVFVGIILPGKSASPWLIVVGSVAIASCLILWNCLRRPSTEQIRYYRIEIKRLVDEIQRIQESRGEKFSVLDQLPTTAVGVAQQQLQNAKNDWQDALRFEGLPEDITPKSLLARLKQSRSILSSDFEEHSFESEIDDLRRELSSKVDWLTNWKLRLIEFTNSESVSVDDSASYLLRLVKEFRQMEGADSESNGSVERLLKLQKQLKGLKEKRLGQLEQCGCESLKELKQQLVVLQEQVESDHRKEDLTQEINRYLASCENADQVRAKIKTSDEDALLQDSSKIERKLVKVQAEIVDLDRKDRELDKNISRLLSESAAAYAELERDIRTEQRKSIRRKLLCYMILSNSRQTARDETPLGLQLATEFFRQTTDWQDAEIGYSESEKDFVISKSANQQKLFADLSSAVQKQAGLCIQLATAKVLADQEGLMPFVLTGDWVSPGSRFTDANAQLMIELAEQDMQFIIIVGDDHSAQLFRDYEQPVLVVDLKQETVVYEVDADEANEEFSDADTDFTSERGLVDLNPI